VRHKKYLIDIHHLNIFGLSILFISIWSLFWTI